ncbi:hypothetical protein ACJX0J_014809, partial [Zea mays]
DLSLILDSGVLHVASKMSIAKEGVQAQLFCFYFSSVICTTVAKYLSFAESLYLSFATQMADSKTLVNSLHLVGFSKLNMAWFKLMPQQWYMKELESGDSRLVRAVNVVVQRFRCRLLHVTSSCTNCHILKILVMTTVKLY